jgi:cytochrome c peroxidase
VIKSTVAILNFPYFCAMNRLRLFVTGAFVAAFLGLNFQDPLPTSSEKLGERLFFDPILSLDSTISCSSCHIPEFAFCDTALVSKGVGGSLGKRNSPGITNMKFRAHFFFDGRAATLEQQVLMPVRDPLEMRFSAAQVVERLRRHREYSLAFEKIYHRQPDTTLLATALADFVRTLETSDTPFDRWMQGQADAMSASAIRGREVFMKKGKCFDCHFSPDFTGDEFRNVGLYTGRRQFKDRGRFDITGDSTDLGKFKVPGLRNVALTAPYMHNGMFRTLEEVIEFYDQPNQTVPGGINRDTLLNAPLNLTTQEKEDLKQFLEALTDDRFVKR